MTQRNDPTKVSKDQPVKQELSDCDLESLSGGFKFHKHERNPTQVPLSEPRDD